VDGLIKQVADEQNIEMGKMMEESGHGKVGAGKESKVDIGSLGDRLNNLKQS